MSLTRILSLLKSALFSRGRRPVADKPSPISAPPRPLSADHIKFHQSQYAARLTELTAMLSRRDGSLSKEDGARYAAEALEIRTRMQNAEQLTRMTNARNQSVNHGTP